VTKDRPRNCSGGAGPGGSPTHIRQAPKSGKPHLSGGPGRTGGPARSDRSPYQDRRESQFQEGDDVWIWGLHAAAAALENPRRDIRQAILTVNAAARLGLDPDSLPPYATLLEGKDIDHRLPSGAVHQGVGIKAAHLPPLDISDAVMAPDKPLVILDQVTDPQNVGAVFRSAAAFGFGGVVMQTRHAPALGGALAKAAAGAIEKVAEVRAVNLARAIDLLTESGWRVIGLDGSAEQDIQAAFGGPEPLAIVLGAEGEGIRPAVANACTQLARIRIGAAMESLNVSNAAAISFYEAHRR